MTNARNTDSATAQLTELIEHSDEACATRWGVADDAHREHIENTVRELIENRVREHIENKDLEGTR
jgi:hypothetical protein